jgi:hypothetical protein
VGLADGAAPGSSSQVEAQIAGGAEWGRHRVAHGWGLIRICISDFREVF